jgi:hypothetical protein
MSQLPFYSAALVAGRLALAAAVIAVAVCWAHLQRLRGDRLRAGEGALLVAALVVDAAVSDLTIAALAMLALLAVVIAPVARRV